MDTSRTSVATPTQKPGAKPGKDETASKKKKWLIALLALLAFFAIGFGVYAATRPDEATVAKAKLEEIRNDSELTGREKWDKTRKVFEGLSNDGKRDLGKERREAENKKLEEFFKKSKEEQRKELKEEIQRGEKRRKEWEARAKAEGWGNNGPGGGGNRGGGNGPGGAGAPAANANAAGGANNGNANGPGGRPQLSAEERQQRRDDRIDMLTPDERAMRHQYTVLMNEARISMGLPPSFRGPRIFVGGPPGGGFGGPRGGGGPPTPPPNPPPPAPATGS